MPSLGQKRGGRVCVAEFEPPGALDQLARWRQANPARLDSGDDVVVDVGRSSRGGDFARVWVREERRSPSNVARHNADVVDSDDAWLSVVRAAVPLGKRVSGVVVDRRVFGVFLELDETSTFRAIIEINNYRPEGHAVPPDDLPAVGSIVTATVVDHVALNRQVRLSVVPVR